MGYFARRYNFQVLGTVVPGPDADAETSAQQLSQLIRKIRAAKVPAIFAEASVNTKWIEQVAAETKVKVVHDLHIGSLGPVGADNGTYIGSSAPMSRKSRRRCNKPGRRMRRRRARCA